MTSDLQSNKARDVVLLVGLVLFVLSGLAIEVESSETTSSCAGCGSHRSTNTRHWYVWGSHGSSLTEDSMQPCRFQMDFPEFKCDHQWSDESLVERKIWDSPVIRISHHPIISKSCCFCGGMDRPVWERYETDEAYRNSIQELLEIGAATREQLIALAKDWDYQHKDPYNPEEEAILKTLFPDPYGCPTKIFIPLGQPFVQDLPKRNERPPI